MNSDVTLTAILPLARAGWRLFPVASRSKEPAIKNWQTLATTDETRLREWQETYPRCNWAVATGAGSRLWALDVDGEAGTEWYSKERKTRGDAWTQTPKVKTARGFHLYFRWPEDGTVLRNSVAKIAPGVDTRGEGGYTLIPPSVHPTGASYLWLTPPTLAVLPAVDWSLSLATNASKLESSPATGDGSGVIPEGERNSTLASLAGSMRRRGMSQDAIAAGLLAENKRACDPPLPENEVVQIAASVARYQPESKLRTRPVRNSAPVTDIQLLRSENGAPRPIVENVLAMLRQSSEWAGALAYNEFTNRAVFRKPAPFPSDQRTPRDWTDNDTVLATGWMQRAGILIHSMDAVGRAAQTVARETSFHPVRDYLRALSWDGTERIATWLVDFFGAPKTEYVSAVGSRWLISAVARIMIPGVQVDHTLLLEGGQGIGKSSGLRALVGDAWFCDHLSVLGTKDSRIELQGRWVIEISELSAMRRAEIETVKSYLTQRFDSFRAPYARTTENVPRQNVFAATTNADTPLADESGNRRFWPVRCGSVRVQDLAQSRDQLWAESFAAYVAKRPWWLESRELETLAEGEQETRYTVGPWDEAIRSWINRPKIRETERSWDDPLPWNDSVAGKVNATDVLVHCVGKDLSQIQPRDLQTVGRCLRHLGWRPKQESVGRNRGKRFYISPEPPKAGAE